MALAALKSNAGASGNIGLQIIRAQPPRQESEPCSAVPARELSLREIFYYGFPHKPMHPYVYEWRKANLPNLWRGLKRVMLARKFGIAHMYGQLSLMIIRADGTQIDLGLASMRVVTTVGVNYIVDAFANGVELEDMKYHGIGTGGTAEAVGDTALVTELTTQYSVDNTRATGSTTEGATANVYRTLGTNQVDATVAITEHGVFSAAAVASGVLLDRTLFAANNLNSGDSLASTYDLTLTAGS